jgi:hypothetical protein
MMLRALQHLQSLLSLSLLNRKAVSVISDIEFTELANNYENLHFDG